MMNEYAKEKEKEEKNMTILGECYAWEVTNYVYKLIHVACYIK